MEEIKFSTFFISLVVIAIVLIGIFLSAALISLAKEELEKANEAFRCTNAKCKKLIRQYQMDLYYANKQTNACPHCGHPGGENYHLFNKVEIYYPWMDTIIDAPLINRKSLHHINKTIKTLKSNRAEMDMQLSFEEYNKLNPNVEWVKNISSIEMNQDKILIVEESEKNEKSV